MEEALDDSDDDLEDSDLPAIDKERSIRTITSTFWDLATNSDSTSAAAYPRAAFPAFLTDIPEELALLPD